MGFESANIAPQEESPKEIDKEEAKKEFESFFRESPDGSNPFYFLNSAVVAAGLENPNVETLKKNGFENMDDLHTKLIAYEKKYSVETGLVSDVNALRNYFMTGDLFKVRTNGPDLIKKIRSLEENPSFLG